MTSVTKIDSEQLVNDFRKLPLQDQKGVKTKAVVLEKGCEDHGGICAICLEKISLQEVAYVKGCQHAYCLTCILQWATYSKAPTCPQCKHPFEFLDVRRSLDGDIHDYMFEENVCILLTAAWFEPLNVEDRGETYDDLDLDLEQYCFYEFEDEDDDDQDEEVYYASSSNVCIGNRRWGDNGYIRAGRQEARPVYRANAQDSGAGSSREPKKKETGKTAIGRRAKRSLKREAADKAAMKLEENLLKLAIK